MYFSVFFSLLMQNEKSFSKIKEKMQINQYKWANTNQYKKYEKVFSLQFPIT